ncbi:unnamed protein product [Orchesella dallaii]|uniref:Uncharacterized protein n=1 Tax=Orchesella dallaii TaxID=48710 RepID=A0ABP1PQM6_9HEXA
MSILNRLLLICLFLIKMARETGGSIEIGPSQEGVALTYQLAAEQAQLSTFQRALRPLKNLWWYVGGTIGGIGTVGRRVSSEVGGAGTLLKNEVFVVFHDIKSLPSTTLQMWRNGDFKITPSESIRELIGLLTWIKEDFLFNWNHTFHNATQAWRTKWTLRCKLYIGSIVLLSMFTIYHKKLRPWPVHNKKTEIDPLHKTVVITGASCGIGYRLAYEFAKRGCFVILTSPEMVKARKARLDLSQRLMMSIKRDTKVFLNNLQVRYMDQAVLPYQLDLSFVLQNIVEVDLNLASTASVYSFTRKVQGMSPEGIDILINNAATIVPPEELVVTEEGREAHFAVNYYGHFALTNLLLSQLAKRKGARIINVTCKKAAEQGFIKMEEFIGPYLEEEGLPFLPAVDGYANSKLALYLFNRQLAKELCLASVHNVTTYCVCPGSTRTFLNRHIRLPYFQRVWNSIEKEFYKSDWHAVQPILYCALSPKCARESGFFYENNRRACLRSRHKNQDEVAEELWNLSKSLMTIGHQPMLKLTEQMHMLSHENIFQLAHSLFLHRRDVMTHLLLLEEKQTYRTRHRKHTDEKGDAREDFTYFWHGFYLTGGDKSTLIERWVLQNTHPGFRELQKEYDIFFECTGSAHYHPKNNGKMAALQYMSSFPAPLEEDDIEELEKMYGSDSEPDEELENRPRFHEDLIPMEDLID